MIQLTRTTGCPVGINSRRVLYVDHLPGKSSKHGAQITMNNGDHIQVQERPEDVVKRVDKDRRKG